ncbi:MAG: ATP-binding cassette domain-containing protein [Bacillales bacterium]|nr:ATP-binding cassette domain-containing protein [Erysipelotrichaceae bacterium]MDD7382087.1 ATP-binding cassette domain-containing protein [Bacillales bacterium]
MEKSIEVISITKEYILSKKQMKLDKTTSKIKVAVSDLSFSVYKGEIYGLLGPNGAGKTTTLRCISTLISPTQGDIIVDGASVNKNAEEVRKKIAFLTSDLKLEEFFTPNYMFDYYSTLHHIEPSVIKERKEYLFDKFGINKFAEVKIGELSTGMKQKTSLAVSLCHDPDIIIFDEPTNGLDVLTSKIVTDFLLELKEKGKTIIVSTHIFSLIEKICDRVGIIINGKMVKEDNLTSLTKEKKLEDVFFDLYKESVGEE